MSMQVGVFLVLCGRWPLDKALAYVRAVGWQAVELGSSGYGGALQPQEVLGAAGALARLWEAVRRREFELSALLPWHPAIRTATSRGRTTRRVPPRSGWRER
jgi:sugar phosphate isomerase/epimerase